MGFSEAFQKGISNIGNFQGRASRPEFWWFVLGVWIAEFVIVLFINLIFRNGGFFSSFLLFIVWVVAFVTTMLGALALAYVLHVLVEKPSLRLRDRLAG